jgi:IS30 family transposase
MEKRFLEDCVAKGMSLDAIGAAAKRDPSTVSYWLKKHGLVAAHAEKTSARGAPEVADLELLLTAGLSLREIAQRLDRSLGTIRHWMRRYELRPSPRRKHGAEDGQREMVSRCRRLNLFAREVVTTGVNGVGWRPLGVDDRR